MWWSRADSSPPVSGQGSQTKGPETDGGVSGSLREERDGDGPPGSKCSQERHGGGGALSEPEAA